MLPQVRCRDGLSVPLLGQGTWEMGLEPGARQQEVAALQLGFDLGMTLVDTAEMYANGGAERVVGEALRGRREQIFVVSKVLPSNATRKGTIRAAERSLRRLGVDAIDLYLLHWPGNHPLEGTLAAFEELRQAGKIRYYGVSNFDVADMQEAEGTANGAAIVANQVYYNLNRRGIERNLLPWCREREILVMAYSPLEQGRVPRDPTLQEIARRHGVSVEQIALAWTMRASGVMAIPKSSRAEHVRQNAAAASLRLEDDDLLLLDRAFPRPDRDVPLETL